MLRITTHTDSNSIILELEGRLVGPWVGELERCWQSVRDSPPPHPLRLNLAGVTFIDAAGKDLLSRMHCGGARLEAAGLLVQSILDEFVRQKDGQS